MNKNQLIKKIIKLIRFILSILIIDNLIIYNCQFNDNNNNNTNGDSNNSNNNNNGNTKKFNLFVYGTNIKLTQRNNHANISELLNNLLRGYDNSIRPDFGGPPATVEVDIMVRSMGPISEVDMTYSMDCYFRQSWVDKRLAFKGAQDTLALSISMLARIWKPDTYFYNGKQSYLHTITTPNKFVRIYQDGRVLYSSRLTIKAGCPMNLEDFPMDIQRCPLKFGSFGYTTKDVIYRWNGARQAVAIAEDMKLSQFDLVDCPAGNSTDIILKTSPISITDDGSITSISDRVTSYQYSMLMVNFHLQRHMGNFLIQVYGPCCLLVILSWVSFWLNREATADRISLGITTVLTMTFLGLEARTDLPKVPYLTALDFFVFLSFAFIFATILQFAVVHYFTKYGSGECYFIIDQYDSDTESDNLNDLNDDDDLDRTTISSSKLLEQISTTKTIGTIGTIGTTTGTVGTIGTTSATTMTTTTIDLNDTYTSTEDESKIFEVIPLSVCSLPTAIRNEKRRKQLLKKHKNSSKSWFTWNCFKRKNKTGCSNQQNTNARKKIDSSSDKEIITPRKRLSFRQNEQSQYRRKRKRRQPHFNSVSKIDRASRIVFPILFLIINVFYWCAYLARSSRWTPNNGPAT